MNKKHSKIIAVCAGIITACTLICTAFAADGVVSKLVKNNVKEGSEITLPVNEPTKDGYSFVGWKLKDVDNGKIYDASDKVKITADMSSDNENVTFIPNWSDYTVKYAVRIYGIKQDVDENNEYIGLTFGPAGGYDKDFIYTSKGRTKYKSCGEGVTTCLHNMTWEEIVQVAKTNPEQFEKCMHNRCTKAVPFNITGSLADGATSYAGQMDDCDGASALSYSIADAYTKWNDSDVTTGGWRDSKIRNTLTGATSEAIASHGGNLTEDQSLYAMLPQVLKDNIVPKKVISATTSSKSSELATTYDTLWLFSTKEMYKNYTGNGINEREGELYQSQDYLRAVSTSSTDFTTVNRFYDESGRDAFPWSRSLYSSDDAVHFGSNGYPYGNSARLSCGFVPGFCVGKTGIKGPDPYTVKYAVRIYGIKQDEDEAGNKIGLTFGPAGGYDDGTHSYCYAGTHTDSSSYYGRNDKYRSCGEGVTTCLHNMTWEEIVQVAKTNPEQFTNCMHNRCTKAVPFNIMSSITVTSYKGEMDDCDGASMLYESIASSYRQWNPNSDTAGGWRDSKVRNTLTGVKTVHGKLTEDQSLYAMLPQVLKDNIVPKKVISATSSSRTSELAETYDTLWLFSSYEMYAPGGYNYDDNYIDEREGQLYQSQEYLNAIGTRSTDSTTVNRFYDEIGSYDHLWSRSLNSSYRTVCFDRGGYPDYDSVSYAYHGLAPGFCLG